MRFALVDRIVLLEPGERITTTKSLSLSEEYLAHHFPRFPVMPGVLMLEAMTQAGAWLIRVTDDFSHSVVVLKHVRNLRFKSFVSPGHVLTIRAKITQYNEHETTLEVRGEVADRVAASGWLILERFNFADQRTELAATDERIRRHFKELFSVIYTPAARSSIESQKPLAAIAGVRVS